MQRVFLRGDEIEVSLPSSKTQWFHQGQLQQFQLKLLLYLDTREALTEIVEVGPGGTIESWSWVNSPRSHHLLKTPFAFALIKLDGADTAMLHMVSDCDESDLSIGKKVLPVWSRPNR